MALVTWVLTRAGPLLVAAVARLLLLGPLHHGREHVRVEAVRVAATLAAAVVVARQPGAVARTAAGVQAHLAVLSGHLKAEGNGLGLLELLGFISRG